MIARAAKAPKVGADDFIASGHHEADPDTLPREQLVPTLARQGDAIILTHPQHGVTLKFDALAEHGKGLHAELLITTTVAGEVHWARLDLASTSAREQLVKKLEKSVPRLPWRSILERACRTVALTVRAGVPAEPLVPVSADPHTRHLVSKLMVAGETNVIFADGGSGKSLLALAAGIAVGLPIGLPGGLTPAHQAPVLYLDWESCREEHQDRLAKLLGGLETSGCVPEIFYRPMTRALTDDIAFVRGEVERLKISLVIVDSLAPACGPEPESTDAGVRTMNALRSLGPATRLVIAHVSKASAEQRGPSKPFGSIFIQNLARNVWEVRRAEEDEGDDLVLGLYHSKVNSGRRLAPFGLRFEFCGPAIHLLGHDLASRPDLLARMSLRYRIQKALSTGARSVADLVDETGGRSDTVTRTLRRLRGDGKVIELENARWGLRA